MSTTEPTTTRTYLWQLTHRLPCGCNLTDGYCADHSAMLVRIRRAWDSAPADLVLVLWELQDGYGEPGYVPEQGHDWSGVRDSSLEAIEAMHAAVSA